MLLTVDQLISTLRLEVNIANSQSGLMDSGLLDMTDEQLATILTLGASRLGTDADSLEEMLEEDGSMYPVMLLAKYELFLTLATLKADLVDMNADNNNRLSLGQRFSHYMQLAEAAENAFKDWDSENDASTGGTGGVLTVYDVIHTNRFMSSRNYQLQAKPVVKLKVRNLTENSADVSWSVSNTDHFGLCRLYVGSSPVIDIYLDGGSASSKVSESARLLRSTTDIRNSEARLSGLLPSTTYYVGVVAIERNGVWGFKQKAFTTLEEPEDESEE